MAVLGAGASGEYGGLNFEPHLPSEHYCTYTSAYDDTCLDVFTYLLTSINQSIICLLAS